MIIPVYDCLERSETETHRPRASGWWSWDLSDPKASVPLAVPRSHLTRGTNEAILRDFHTPQLLSGTRRGPGSPEHHQSSLLPRWLGPDVLQDSPEGQVPTDTAYSVVLAAKQWCLVFSLLLGMLMQ